MKDQGQLTITIIKIFHDGLVTIDKWAFNACSSLMKVSIPKTVTKIGEYASDPRYKMTFKSLGALTCEDVGHKYASLYTIDKRASETEDGSESKHCTVCNASDENSKKTIYKASKVSLSTGTYTYNGKMRTPTVYVKDSKGNTISEENYTITPPSGRKNVGKYTYTVTFKNAYEGSKNLTLTIKPKKLTKLTLSKSTYVYDGKTKKPTVTVKADTLTPASKISKDTNSIDVTYASGRTKVGAYKVTVKGKGNYTGTLTKTFKINPKSTSITKVTKGSKSLTVKWSKRSTQTTGYQICYGTSTNRDKGKKVLVKSYKTTSKKITGLKKNKKYYVWVRTYKTVNGTKYYSEWSGRKSVTTK